MGSLWTIHLHIDMTILLKGAVHSANCMHLLRSQEKLERVCSQLMEIINATGSCNVAGSETNGVFKYNSLQLIGETTFIHRFHIYTNFTFSNVQFFTWWNLSLSQISRWSNKGHYRGPHGKKQDSEHHLKISHGNMSLFDSDVGFFSDGGGSDDIDRHCGFLWRAGTHPYCVCGVL